ncbi:Trypanosomal VSG domain [Trypanosoma vivax]|nr:Trypanosomal VSG domain [Trypanosoma vivax]
MRSAKILLACVVALALGWRECADAAPAVKGANMPFISIVCNLVQIAEVVKRDALVDTEKEFFAALNAALGIGRDDAPWQWALNSGNARLAGIAQAAIGNWSAEEKITNETADSVCSPRAGTLACDAVKAFNEYSRTRMLAAQQATEAIAPDATKRRAAWRTTTQTESRKPKHSGTLCLAATAVYLCTGEAAENPCTVNGKDPEGGPIKSGEQTDAGAVAEQWDKLNPAVCHAPHKNRTFHDGEDEHAIALVRYNLQDRKSGGGGKHTLGNCNNFNEDSDTGCVGYESDVASGKAYTAWMDNLRTATKALRAARSAYDLAKKHIDEIEQAKHRLQDAHTHRTDTDEKTRNAQRAANAAQRKSEEGTGDAAGQGSSSTGKNTDTQPVDRDETTNGHTSLSNTRSDTAHHARNEGRHKFALGLWLGLCVGAQPASASRT